MQTMIEYAIRRRQALFAFGVLAMVIAYPFSTRLETEQTVASLFRDDDETLRQYQNLKRWFGKEDALVLMYRDQALATPEGMERSHLLTEKVKAIDGVTAALSPWVLNEAAEGMQKVATLPFAQANESDETPRLMHPDDPVGRGLSDVFAGYTHSTDYSHAAVVAMIRDTNTVDTVTALKELARSWQDQESVSNVSLVGEPVLVDEAFSLVRRDGNYLAVTTIVLLSLVVAVALFDLRLVGLLALVISWSVVMTKAIMFAIGISLSLIASILTAIVTVVSVTAVLHLGVRYHSSRGRGFSPRESAREVLQQMTAPIFWTCATDAAGFAALWFSEILPVRQFGLMVALAALNVFVAVMLFASFFLILPEFMPARSSNKRHSVTRWFRRICFRIARLFTRKPLTIVVCSVLMMAGAVVIVMRSETETSFLRNFRDDSSIVRDYGNVEQNLGGAGVWDLIVDVPESISNDFLVNVQQMQHQLLADLGGPQGLRKAISIADATEVLGNSAAGKWMPAEVRIEAMRTRLPTFIGALISDPIQTDRHDTRGRKLRIMLRSAEGLSADEKHQLISGVQRIASQHVKRWDTSIDPDSTAETDNDGAQVTGYYVIMTRLVDQLVSDQWRCFTVSAVLIWFLMTMATRSFRLATAALLPNLMPAFLVLATVSLTGGRINMGAAMIAAVSVGLSIDGSVHLLTAYRRRRRLGHRAAEASVSAAGNIGAPVILATIALVVGFSVLSTSEFIPTATFGTLVAWTMVIGSLVNLSLLPALIKSLDR